MKGVEVFYGLVEDVQAYKGVLVCPAGFTPSARKTARKRGVDLFRPVDTGDHKWRVQASVPVICDVRTCMMFVRR
ncbi:restriction endonuclease [Cupriavidus pinatubonensis]|nr:restriction endonuclease [Cupriavidus pinatubonensis]